ncbi:MAG: IgA Peptidase M64 [Prolixibacteraceae bacterium]|nr:IgA Peptidase M64 [Prolixibacteraceae bacterium]
MRLFLIFTLLFFISVLSLAGENSDTSLCAEAIRYDFELIGNKSSVQVIHAQTKFLPSWGGGVFKPEQPATMGNYRYSVYNCETGELFYQKGFSPLFYEWRLTAEANNRYRSYEHSAHFPRLANNVKIEIQNRDSLNQWNTLFADTVFIADNRILDEKYVVPDIDTVMYSGNSSKKIDLVFLSEGYTRDQLPKFVSDVKRLADSLFEAAPYCNFKNRFNIFAVKVPSAESGCDMPTKDEYRNTAFDSHYNTFGSYRYLTTSAMKDIYDVLDGIGWDHIVLLVNTDRYGGGGFYNFYSICTVDNEKSPFVFIHEFGHAFAGLADEYYYSEPGNDDFYSPEWEPWEPNISTLHDFDKKWKTMIEPGIPVPTSRDSTYIDKVGVFEGGGYQEKGVYSPFQTCWMKEQAAGKFCPVCQKAIEEVILKQSK